MKEPLILPCEIAVRSVIPAIKAAMAKELVEVHHLKQNEAAKILGISQSAVSKYTRQVRGYVIKIEDIAEVHPLIGDMINLLTSEDLRRVDFLRLFCQTCLEIRKKGLMCQFCRKTEPEIDVETCKFCQTYNPFHGER